MKSTVMALLTVILFGSGIARAEKMDLAKITCEQITNAFLEDVVVIGAWLSGYYNAKRDNTVVDSRQIATNTSKVMQFCHTRPQETVMRAIELVGQPQ
jgi:hypothetical protein